MLFTPYPCDIPLFIWILAFYLFNLKNCCATVVICNEWILSLSAMIFSCSLVAMFLPHVPKCMLLAIFSYFVRIRQALMTVL